MLGLMRQGRQTLRLLSRSIANAASDVGSKEHIDGLVKEGKVVVFMKGTPEQPQCGFSNAVCQVLNFHEVPFKGHNVLADDRLRSGIKEYSKWPTIPQIYVEGEFIGGCDILIQMHKNGELIECLDNAGIKSPHASKE